MRRRRWALLLVPTIAVLGLELAIRPRQLASFAWAAPDAASLGEALAGSHALAWTLSLVHSALLWGSLLALTRRDGAVGRVASGAFIALFSIAMGVQAAFRLRWAVYVSRDATELSDRPLRAILGSLRADTTTLLSVAGAAVVALLALALVTRGLPRRLGARGAACAGVIALASLVAALTVPVSYRGAQATSPDLLWLNGVAFAARGPEDDRVGLSSPQLRSPDALPALEAQPSRTRNVVLVLQESQRADVTCVAFSPACALATGASNARAPGRLPLENLRSNASSTTIAMSVLLTGLAPTAPAEDLATAPNVFELAAAAGWDTAYLTSQHLMFANMWLLVEGVPSRRVVLGTHLDPRADMWRGAEDDALAAMASAELAELREPFFLVVHFSNVHAPRHVGRGAEPFQPASDEKHDRAAYFNGYKNAVHQSDQAVARWLAALRSSAVGERTVVVYTADHGEANGEHDQGCDHGCTIFEEEVRVPGWIDAPEGTLTEGERASLGDARRAYAFHTDLAATLVDLMGLWDEPRLVAARARMLGSPLTRPLPTERPPVPLSNVSHVWERGRPSYGLMQGPRKLVGLQRDPGWRCYDVARDPLERAPIEHGCPDLVREAEALYGVPPSDFTTLREHAAKR